MNPVLRSSLLTLGLLLVFGGVFILIRYRGSALDSSAPPGFTRMMEKRNQPVHDPWTAP